jgi:probable phosphoglycerate mutase
LEKPPTPSGSVELWLVRHGETPRSRARHLAGWADIPLTDEGENQARAVRPLLAGQSFDAVWSSDLQRTMASARLAFGEPAPDRRLREIDFGSLDGLPYADLAEPLRLALERFEGFAAPGGESLLDVRRRALEWADGLRPGRHLVFTHGGVIRTLGKEAGANQFVPTGSVVVLDWTAKRLLATHLRPTS